MIWVFFLNKRRKFGKMLSKDQVQMVASNQQAAGVFSAAAASHRSVPSTVIGLSVLHCIKLSIKHHQSDSGARFSVTKLNKWYYKGRVRV